MARSNERVGGNFWSREWRVPAYAGWIASHGAGAHIWAWRWIRAWQWIGGWCGASSPRHLPKALIATEKVEEGDDDN